MAIASAPGSRPANGNVGDFADGVAPAVRDAIVRIEQDGYVVLERMLSPAQIAAARDGVKPYAAAGCRGRNPFEGHLTERIFTLVDHAPIFAEIATDPTVIAICRECLAAA